MQLPIDAELLEIENESENDSADVTEIIDSLLERRKKAFSIAKQNINEAQGKQKRQYDSKHSGKLFSIGTEVLVENTADKQRKGGKLNTVWRGPYTISRFIGKGVYELSDKEGNVIRNKVNVNRLKAYIRRSAELFKKSDTTEVTSNCGEDEVRIVREGATDSEEEKYDVVTDKGKKRKYYDECDQPPPKKHCNRVTKTDQLVQEILCGKELTDEHMAIACELLKTRFPFIGGMQSPLLAQTNGFSSVCSYEESVQLHHTGQFHWVTSALLKGKVYVFDSSFKGISSSMKVQLSLIYKSLLQPEASGKKNLKIECPSVCQQIGNKDCGVFSIAFAFHAGRYFLLRFT